MDKETSEVIAQLRAALSDGAAEIELLQDELVSRKEAIEEVEQECESVREDMSDTEGKLEAIHNLLDSVDQLKDRADDLGVNCN